MQTQTFTATDQGFYSEDGAHEPLSESYTAGLVGGDELRNFFAFNLTNAFEVTAATFRLDAETFASSDSDELFRLFDVSTDVSSLVAGGSGLTGIFDDLGAGSSFGEITLSDDDNRDVVSITFNAEGIAALNAAVGGLFAVGGAVASIGSSLDQLLFGFSGFSEASLRLETTGADDLAADAGTLGVVALGETVESHIGTADDHDWFAVELVAGETYVISLDGTASNGLGNPLLALFDGASNAIAGNNNGGPGLNALLTFTATETGTHFLEASSADFGLGSYELTVNDTLEASTGTTSTVAVNGAVDGVIGGIGDADWHGVSFLQGDTYQIVLAGDGSDGEISDTVLRLFDDEGNEIANNDDFEGLFSTLFFTAENDDTFFIGAEGFTGLVGGYTITVTTDLTGHSVLNDTLDGGIGDDLIQGLGGSDALLGGRGRDTLVGGNNNDNLSGENDDDVIDGGNGRDTIDGGRGNDLIDAGTNNDVIIAGNNNDTITSGSGDDVIVYRDLREGRDTILDFEDGVDLIDLSQAGVGGFTVLADGDDTLVLFGNTQIRLVGIAETNVTSDDFIFA